MFEAQRKLYASLSLNICKGALALLLSYIWRGKRPQTGPYMILRASINSNLHMFLERSIEPLENWRSIQQKVSYLKSWGRLWAWTWANVFLGRRLILQGLCMRRQTESASSLCQSNPSSQDRLASKETCALVDTAAEVKAPPVSVNAFLRDRRIEAIPAFHRSVGVRIDVQMSKRQIRCQLRAIFNLSPRSS